MADSPTAPWKIFKFFGGYHYIWMYGEAQGAQEVKKKTHLESILTRGSWDRDSSYQGGLMGPKLLFEKKSLKKLLEYISVGLGIILWLKSDFWPQKWVFWAMIAEALKNYSYWPKNNFFIIRTPKPAYIYPNNFPIKEIKNWSHGG